MAALIADDARLARTLRADGVHLGVGKDLAGAYEEARSILGQRGIVGVDAGISRHDAMTLAEAGADYIAFGAPSHLKDRDKARARRDELDRLVGGDLPGACVAFDVETPEEAEALGRGGRRLHRRPAADRRDAGGHARARGRASPRRSARPRRPAEGSPVHDRLMLTRLAAADGRCLLGACDGGGRDQLLVGPRRRSRRGGAEEGAAGEGRCPRPSRSSRPCRARPRPAGDAPPPLSWPSSGHARCSGQPARQPTCQPAAARRHRRAAPRPPAPASTPRRRPPGEDAAYEAFDQGKYLTALDLAPKAAEKGDPQAHTLVGRIYAEGYGAPQEPDARRPVVRARRRARRSRGHVRLRRHAGRGQGVAKDRDAAGADVRGRGRAASIRSPTTIWRCCSSRATASRRTPIAPSRTCCLRPRPAWRRRNTIWARSTPPAPASSPTPSRPPSGSARRRPPATPRRRSTTP